MSFFEQPNVVRAMQNMNNVHTLVGGGNNNNNKLRKEFKKTSKKHKKTSKKRTSVPFDRSVDNADETNDTGDNVEENNNNSNHIINNYNPDEGHEFEYNFVANNNIDNLGVDADDSNVRGKGKGAKDTTTFIPMMLPEDARDVAFETPGQMPDDPQPSCELCRIGHLINTNNTGNGGNSNTQAEETYYARAIARFHEFYVCGLPDENNAVLVALEFNEKCYVMDQRRKGLLGLRPWTGSEVLFHFRNHTRNPYYMLQDDIVFLQRSMKQLRRSGIWKKDVNDITETPQLDRDNLNFYMRMAKQKMDLIKQCELLRQTASTSGGSSGNVAGATGAGGSVKRGKTGRFSDPNAV